MLSNPTTDKRKWKIHEDHRYPFQGESPYTHLASSKKQHLSEAITAIMLCQDGLLLLQADASIISRIQGDERFLQEHNVSTDDIETLSEILLTIHQDALNFMRLDLLEIDESKRDHLKKQALRAAMEYHLAIPFMDKSWIDKMRGVGLIPQGSRYTD